MSPVLLFCLFVQISVGFAEAERQPNIHTVVDIVKGKQKCLDDKKVCVNGFFKWTTNPTIYRLMDCNFDCGTNQMGIGALFGDAIRANIDRVEYLVPHGDPRWEGIKELYEKQTAGAK